MLFLKISADVHQTGKIKMPGLIEASLALLGLPYCADDSSPEMLWPHSL
jgi:hypothetical protein